MVSDCVFAPEVHVDIKKLYEEHQRSLGRRIDRTFGWLILFQWLLVVVMAVARSTDVWYAVILGGVISAPALYFSFAIPGQSLMGRYVIAIAQIIFSTLLIHFSGGRLEAHFHIFASLAFLSTYRNWRLPVVASLVAILDHVVRGHYFPLSIYGTTTNVEWLWLEHSAWILFANVFLGYSCIRSDQEMWRNANVNSELMKLRLAAENLNIRRTHFFSLISHELRTPLNGIVGFSDLLANSPIPQEQKEYASIIKQCSDTLLKLINDLLDFSRIDAGRLDIECHNFKTQEIRQHILNIFALECQKKNLALKFEISEGVPAELVGDSHRIRQVLTNIVGNAIKFTPAGSIYVRLRKHAEDETLYRWDVEDSGIGIKKENLSAIFSPYTQEFSSTYRKFGGSGLGLAISKRLVELMGGQLRVESTPGKGTNFSFSIPLKRP